MNKKFVEIRKAALYKGYRISVMKRDDDYYYVGANNVMLPSGLFIDMQYSGPLEYYGKIERKDPDLVLLD